MNDAMHSETRPGWASFFTPAQFSVFQTLVQAELQHLGLDAVLQDGVAQVRSADGARLHLGLQNLAQLCLAKGEPDWEATIARHLAITLRRHEESDPALFEEIKPLLKLRIFAAPLPAEPALVGYLVAPGLAAVLALDLPDSVKTVSPGQLQRWGLLREDALDLALENTLREPVERIPLQSGDGPAIQALHEASFFVSSRLLRLRDWVDEENPNGALVAVPRRDLLLYYPIESMEVVSAISSMLHCASHFFRRGPGSISRDLFWWRNGKLTLLPSEDCDGSFSFRPPGDFLDCLNRIASPS